MDIASRNTSETARSILRLSTDWQWCRRNSIGHITDMTWIRSIALAMIIYVLRSSALSVNELIPEGELILLGLLGLSEIQLGLRFSLSVFAFLGGYPIRYKQDRDCG